MTGVDIAPGVDDRDDRFAEVIGARVAHLRGARMMAERAHVIDAKPAMRAELFGLFALGHGWQLILGHIISAGTVAGLHGQIGSAKRLDAALLNCSLRHHNCHTRATLAMRASASFRRSPWFLRLIPSPVLRGSLIASCS